MSYVLPLLSMLVLLSLIVLYLKLFHIYKNLNTQVVKYRTAACVSMGRLGRLYQKIKNDNNGKIEEIEIFNVWDAIAGFGPQEDIELISGCFYKGIKE